MEATGARPRKAFVRKTVIDLSIMTVIGIVLAFVGPFGSFDQPLGVRMIRWLSFAYIGYAIYNPMGYFVDRAAYALDLPKVPLWVLGVAIATVPMTAAVWSIGFIPRPVPMPTLEQATTSYFYVFVIGGGVTALFYALEARGEAAVPIETEPLSPPQSQTELAPQPLANPLIDQLPAHIGSDVVALEMEDHYVRVHTALGSELVLMRMRDAVAYLSDIEGRQVHRSWWVARGAVEDVKREGRNVRLTLSGGIEAPVSRAQVSELKQAGWI